MFDAHNMNALSRRKTQSLELVDIIDLKWLMARDGHRLHVERIQNDHGYALECLAIAARSPRDAVRDAAARLRTLLGIDCSAA